MIFSKIFTMLLFIVILRCFIFVYVKMSRQCRVSSIQFNASNSKLTCTEFYFDLSLAHTHTLNGGPGAQWKVALIAKL